MIWYNPKIRWYDIITENQMIWYKRKSDDIIENIINENQMIWYKRKSDDMI